MRFTIEIMIKPFTRWFKLALIAGPLSIILHELGHALNALSVGYSEIYITFHSWGGEAPWGIDSMGRAWICAGGPIVSFLIAAACYLFVLLRRDWGFPRALGMMAPVQFMGDLLYVAGSLLGVEASAVYDSARVANHLGASIFHVSIPGSVVLVSAWFLFTRSMDAKNRGIAVLGIIIGGVIGIIFWLTLLGPLILPD